MKNISIAAIAASAMLGFTPAMAQEVAETSTTVATAVETADSFVSTDGLSIDPVCALTNVALSEKAMAACAGDEAAMPRPLKDGSRYSNRGVGAEFNVILANIEVFRAAE